MKLKKLLQNSGFGLERANKLLIIWHNESKFLEMLFLFLGKLKHSKKTTIKLTTTRHYMTILFSILLFLSNDKETRNMLIQKYNLKSNQVVVKPNLFFKD